jgi:tRNA(fMet)-specific endonuclease VapC
MAYQKSLLDSDTVSYLMRGDKQVTAQATAYKAEHGVYTISAITRYEVLKGLRARGATTKLHFFEQFCFQNEVLPLTEDIIVRAAEVYADLHKRGALIDDPDILIAATGLVHNLVVVTNNERRFSRIVGLR